MDEDVDPAISEREAKRKEIQSLILKYSALEEAYEKASGANANGAGKPSAAEIIANKYRKGDRLKSLQGKTDNKADKSNVVVSTYEPRGEPDKSAVVSL